MVHAYFSQRIENIVTDMEMCFSAAESSRLALADAAGVTADDAAEGAAQ